MSGDGGFTMMMGDFISLVQLGLPVKVVVLNNGTLGFVEMEMKACGFLDVGCELTTPTSPPWPRRWASRACASSSRDELEARCAPRCAQRPGAGRRGQRPPGARDAAQGHAWPGMKFGLFLLKAVMNGRAAQVIDLARINLRI